MSVLPSDTFSIDAAMDNIRRAVDELARDRYQDGLRDGRNAGYADGYADGRAEGYAVGCAEGALDGRDQGPLNPPDPQFGKGA